jgi:cell wall-associated NlpC family hydrolase
MPMAASVTKIRPYSPAVWSKPTVVIALLFMAASCTTHPKTVHHSPLSTKKAMGTESAQAERALRDEYKRWQGTKHKMGGTDERGVDCSGFVQAVYGNVFRVDLPRTTRDQLRQGVPVRRSALQPGDLVFFRPPGYPRHVGIYLGGDEFVHASKTRGVTISRIAPHYWGKFYWTARRIHRNR